MKNKLLSIITLLMIWIPICAADNKSSGTTMNVENATKIGTGAVIIDGKYIEPPYTIEARENGIWINGILAEKRIPRKEQYCDTKKKTIQQAIEHEVLADYFELSEEAGKEKAREKIKTYIIEKNKIRGIKITGVTSKTPEEIEIQTDINENVNVKISIPLPKHTEDFMLNLTVSRKYRKWFNSSGNGRKKTFDDLAIFLDIQKNKGRIENYKFENDGLRIKYKGDLVWTMLNSASASEPEDITTLKYPSVTESDKMDKEDLATFNKALNGGCLEVFSKGSHVCAGPDGESTVSELRKIMFDKNLSLNERKKMIKKIYFPARIEEKYLNEVLENFNK